MLKISFKTCFLLIMKKIGIMDKMDKMENRYNKMEMIRHNILLLMLVNLLFIILIKCINDHHVCKVYPPFNYN